MTIANKAVDQSGTDSKVRTVNLLRRLVAVRHIIDAIPLDPSSATALVLEMQRFEAAVSSGVAERVRAAVLDEITYGRYLSEDRNIAMEILNPQDEESAWEHHLQLQAIRERWP